MSLLPKLVSEHHVTTGDDDNDDDSMIPSFDRKYFVDVLYFFHNSKIKNEKAGFFFKCKRKEVLESRLS